jgi:hypothetical protein
MFARKLKSANQKPKDDNPPTKTEAEEPSDYDLSLAWAEEDEKDAMLADYD